MATNPPAVPGCLAGEFEVCVQVAGGGQGGERFEATVMFLCCKQTHGGGRERACGDVYVGAEGGRRMVRIREGAFGVGGGLVALVLVRGEEGKMAHSSKVKGAGVVMRSQIMGSADVRRAATKVRLLRTTLHGVWSRSIQALGSMRACAGACVIFGPYSNADRIKTMRR